MKKIATKIKYEIKRLNGAQNGIYCNPKSQ